MSVGVSQEEQEAEETELLNMQLLQTNLQISKQHREAAAVVDQSVALSLPEEEESQFQSPVFLQTDLEMVVNSDSTLNSGHAPLPLSFASSLHPNFPSPKSWMLQLAALKVLTVDGGPGTGTLQSVFEVSSDQTTAGAVLLAYLMLYLGSVASMLYYMACPNRNEQPKSKLTTTGRPEIALQGPEDETWSRGVLGWLAVSWVSPLVARLGHSFNAAMTKCSPDELPQIGNPDVQAMACHDRFERLWKEEVEAKGEAQASFLVVMVKMWTVRSLACLGLSLAIHMVIGQVYAVLLIQHSLSYFYELQGYVRDHGGQLPDMTGPVLASIGYFSVLPIANIVLCSYESGITLRLDQQLAGVSVALFKKTQRLPASCLGGSAADKDAAANKPNVMMLVNNDLIANVHGICFTIWLCVNSMIAAVVLTVLMAVKLRVATFFCLAVAVPGVLVSGGLSVAVGISIGKLQGFMDQRARAVREVLQGIRVVKSYAWEEAMLAKIGAIRQNEVNSLRVYFRLCGNFVCLFNVFPRLLVLSGLWGYTHFYGAHSVAEVFACMQILASLRSCCETFAGTLARGLTFMPSAKRIEQYLKLEEAPVLPGIRSPSWVKLWSEAEAGSEDAGSGGSGALDHFQLFGSYKWGQDSWNSTVLQEIQLEVLRGEMVAIVGSVGSGKSTLLQAALGELYPVTGSVEAFLCRPRVCAYCSQVPHIAEGTLRDNILFGQSFDQARYSEAIAAACLENDLALLPGGDGVSIGSRGIQLSGGQRARVGLARAAYHSSADLALIDDPFGSVDAMTASVILEKLLLGPLMSSRTRLVVLQPEVERLRRFDKVVIVAKGRILVSGKPEEVFETEEFKKLQSEKTSSGSASSGGSPGSYMQRPTAAPVSRSLALGQEPPASLREEEFEGRPSWEMVKQYCAMGKWRNLLCSLVLFSIMLFLYLLADLSLANWTNRMASDPTVPAAPYLWAYIFWLFCGTVMFAGAWKYGELFSFRISQNVHSQVMQRLLCAPIDRFFDRHPIGRIMNRMTTDLSVIDMALFMKVSGSILIFYQIMIPLVYIHTIMPWLITILAVPFYYVMAKVYRVYQNSSVPVRYCLTTAASHSNSCLSDVMESSVVVRGFGQENRLAEHFALVTDDCVKAQLTNDRLLKRWVVNRMFYLWSFFTTVTYLVGLYNSASLGVGTLGICLTNLLLIEAGIDQNLDLMSGALFELIALARFHEYLSIPQEKPMRVPHDLHLRNYAVSYLRKNAADLTMRQDGDFIQVFKGGSPILQSSKDGRALVLPTSDGKSQCLRLQDLCPSCVELGHAGSSHRIVAANDAANDSKAIAEELCKNKRNFLTASGFSTAPKVLLDLQSGWLADGARVEIDNLRVGYADIPRDVLKGVTFSVAPRMKVAIVGTTGCGKSSLLLALLRVLEPRAGRVLINGVDTRHIGLATLRSSLGLVPQDPILFSGTMRQNLDPLSQYTDGRVKRAVRCAHLEELANSWPLGLDHKISEDGSNLSFGQRQLLCLARMVLRQPAVLLLDEATSAIDPRTQEAVQDTISSSFPSTTMLAVAHRLETIMDFDHVVVMDHGAVAEQGPVKEVAARSDSIFKAMLAAKAQS